MSIVHSGCQSCPAILRQINSLTLPSSSFSTQQGSSYYLKGLFKKSRSASCTDADGKPVEDKELCDESKLPDLSKGCSEAEEEEGSGSGDGSGEGSGSGDGSGEGSGEGSGNDGAEKKTENLSEFVRCYPLSI